MNRLPVFRSVFLNGICRRIEVRSKALKHKGKLTWETKQPDEYEWITFYFEPILGHFIILQFADDNGVNIYVRDRGRKHRGKVLIRLEDLTLCNNSTAIVEALESTIRYAHVLDESTQSEYLDKIQAVWADLQMRVVEED